VRIEEDKRRIVVEKVEYLFYAPPFVDLTPHIPFEVVLVIDLI
jgi:hypothetical protein